MASSRKRSSGRSPLVNQKSQITSFFSKVAGSPTPTPSPSIAKQAQVIPKSNTNPNPSFLNGSPTTPSPVQSKLKNPLFIIGQNVSPSHCLPTSVTAEKSYGNDVVAKRVRVYWPLDKAWYEGCVKMYDKGSGKHLIQYDDAEEELLDLGKEKVEWIEESAKKFKRLRKGLGIKQVVVEEDEDDLGDVNSGDGGSHGKTSRDEDWGKNMEKEESDCEHHMDLEDEDDDGDGKGVVKSRRSESRKRKGSSEEKVASGKKSKNSGDANTGPLKLSVVEPSKNRDNEISKAPNSSNDPLERFRIREAEKLRFLEVGRRDAKRRLPTDVDYDARTLYLPPDFVRSLSGGQRQWWEFKSKHMDKVLFFKMGKFYELFEMDAHIGAKELDLQYMKGEQPHCGFPEKNFSMNVEKLARKGYRVLVVEQTETPEQLELRRKEKGSKDKVVKREVCAVVTRGTLTEGELLSGNPDASYMMALTEICYSNQNFERVFGVCVVDVATSRFILGQFGDDAECSSLCSLLSELKPVEIIKPAKSLSSDTERIISRHTRNILVNELVPVSEFWDVERTVIEVKAALKGINDQSSSKLPSKAGLIYNIEQEDLSFLPDILSHLVNKGEDGSLAVSAFGATLYYLKQAFLHETLLRFAKFESLPCSEFSDLAKRPYMILNASALENLDIFENSGTGDSSGTLYAQINHCVTASGKRLLKSWLARPLFHVKSIKDRQDAVAALQGTNQTMALEFRNMLSRLPDMERLLTRMFSCSEANGRNANKVVLYEDAAKKQLQEFISALRGCDLMAKACSSLNVILQTVESEKLRYLLTNGEGLPDISSILQHFKNAFDWVEANNSGRIIPHEGADMNYDCACKKVKDIESSLKKELKEQRKVLGDASIKYVTVGKEAYLLEVPEHLRGSIPQAYELRSSKKGFYRYWTPNIKKLLVDLSQTQSEKESKLRSILQRLIGQFCEHHTKWRQLVSTIAELDVLISLAIARDFYEGPTCRPVILGSTSASEVPLLSAKGLGHPILRSDSLGKGSFVSNNISIGGSDHAQFILLTGPNMGGKSTLLRQVCLATILAQIGADVPAESFELSPVDRIFVRMGAKDRIMAGQSTFLTELSETALMLSSATRYSLVALDELGRGTSTSDGQAIAEAVLEHFVNKVQCRGMFSTHYHRLAVDYEKDSKVSLCHMACKVGVGSEGVEEVTFLYRLTPGACPKSYGVNVARLAGLPEHVLQKAAAKSSEMEALYNKQRKKGCVERKESERSTHAVLAAILNSINALMKSQDSTGISDLIRHRHEAARFLLEN
ncbi:unnamed protein product [Linum trigynum]|uniref:DNA mismatch repair protein n=1 Tax=Linum trigynum TaxID=586398 RepID=A0AAV2E1N9_9ROSI